VAERRQVGESAGVRDVGDRQVIIASVDEPLSGVL
jgi:hypothetical protein